MKGNHIEKLVEKYESGESTTKEEKYLTEHIDEASPEIKSWFQFIKQHKTNAPDDLNEKLWEKFESKTNTNRKLVITVLSMAASVVLVVSLFFFNTQNNELSYEEKEMILKQAIEMTHDNEQDIANQDIIYEDQYIIIYTKSNEN